MGALGKGKRDEVEVFSEMRLEGGMGRDRRRWLVLTERWLHCAR